MHTQLYYTENVSTNCKRLFFHSGVYLGDLVLDEDGYWKFFPDKIQGGYWDEFLLKTLGEYLTSMNSEYDKQVKDYFDREETKNVQ